MKAQEVILRAYAGKEAAELPPQGSRRKQSPRPLGYSRRKKPELDAETEAAPAIPPGEGFLHRGGGAWPVDVCRRAAINSVHMFSRRPLRHAALQPPWWLTLAAVSLAASLACIAEGARHCAAVSASSSLSAPSAPLAPSIKSAEEPTLAWPAHPALPAHLATFSAVDDGPFRSPHCSSGPNRTALERLCQLYNRPPPISA